MDRTANFLVFANDFHRNSEGKYDGYASVINLRNVQPVQYLISLSVGDVASS